MLARALPDEVPVHGAWLFEWFLALQLAASKHSPFLSPQPAKKMAPGMTACVVRSAWSSIVKDTKGGPGWVPVACTHDLPC